MYGFPRRVPEVWRAYRRPPLFDATRWTGCVLWYPAYRQLGNTNAQNLLTSLTDYSGNNRTGTVSGFGLTLVTHTTLSYVYLMGGTASVSIPWGILGGNAARTFLFVFNHTANINTKNVFFEYGTGTNTTFQLGFGSTGTSYVYYPNGSTTVTGAITLTSAPTNPHVFCFRYDTSVLSAFINGIVVYSATQSINTTTSPTAQLSFTSASAVFTAPGMNECAIYNTALTDDEIRLASKQLLMQYGLLG